MFHKIKEVEPLSAMKLKVVFTDETIKEYDVAPLANQIKVFKSLEDSTLFQNAKVDQGGFGVIWNDDIDLSSDELWKNGIIKTM